MRRLKRLNDKAWGLYGDAFILIKLQSLGATSALQIKRGWRQDLINDLRDEFAYHMYSTYEPLVSSKMEDISLTIENKEAEMRNILPKIEKAEKQATGLLQKRLEEIRKLLKEHHAYRDWAKKYDK